MLNTNGRLNGFILHCSWKCSCHIQAREILAACVAPYLCPAWAKILLEDVLHWVQVSWYRVLPGLISKSPIEIQANHHKKGCSTNYWLLVLISAEYWWMLGWTWGNGKNVLVKSHILHHDHSSCSNGPVCTQEVIPSKTWSKWREPDDPWIFNLVCKPYSSKISNQRLLEDLRNCVF